MKYGVLWDPGPVRKMPFWQMRPRLWIHSLREVVSSRGGQRSMKQVALTIFSAVLSLGSLVGVVSTAGQVSSRYSSSGAALLGGFIADSPEPGTMPAN